MEAEGTANAKALRGPCSEEHKEGQGGPNTVVPRELRQAVDVLGPALVAGQSPLSSPWASPEPVVRPLAAGGQPWWEYLQYHLASDSSGLLPTGPEHE